MLQRSRLSAKITIGIIASLALVIMALVSQPSLKSQSTSTNLSKVEIQLDLLPFTDPISTYVLLNEENRVEVVRYNRYQLRIAAVYRDALPSVEVEGLMVKTRDPAFRQAMRRQNFSGEGLTQGDQFHLSFRSPNNTKEEVFGFLSDVPPIVRTFVNELLALTKQLREAPLAEAYLRSRPIERERFEAIKRDQKLRILSIFDLPSPAQPIISGAINRPGNFITLNKAQYDQLLALTSHGHDFFVSVNGLGHQLTLFQSAK